MDARPVPAPTPESLPYWQGLKDGKLLIQTCAACGKLRHYPRPVCDACFSMEATWTLASGHGTIHSWVRAHHAFLPEFKPDLPYVLVTVDLVEGVRMNARLVGSEADPVIGAPVCFNAVPGDSEWHYPVFVVE